MEKYRFSPIQNEQELIMAVNYVAIKNTELCEKIIGQKLPIKSLTIFSHFQDEYENLVKILFKLGDLYNENNGPRVKLNKPIIVGNNEIQYLRICKPDTERPQVGCNDFETNYESFKKEYLLLHPNNLKLIKRPTYEMMEFFDSNFDVLGYIVSK